MHSLAWAIYYLNLQVAFGSCPFVHLPTVSNPHFTEAVPEWFRQLSARGHLKQIEHVDKLKAGMYGVIRRCGGGV